MITEAVKKANATEDNGSDATARKELMDRFVNKLSYEEKLNVLLIQQLMVADHEFAEQVVIQIEESLKDEIADESGCPEDVGYMRGVITGLGVFLNDV